MSRKLELRVKATFDDKNDTQSLNVSLNNDSFVADIVAVLEECHEDIMKKIVAHAKNAKIDMSQPSKEYLGILETLRIGDIQE